MEPEYYIFSLIKLSGVVLLFRTWISAFDVARPGEVLQEWCAIVGKDRLVLVREWSCAGPDPTTLTCDVRRPDLVPGFS